MPADLPGFYFDTEKNRYFPVYHCREGKLIERPTEIAGTSYQSEGHSQIRVGLASTVRSDHVAENAVLGLIRQREISGNRRYYHFSSNAKAFNGQLLEVHTSKPRVWKYRDTSNCADGGLAQLHVSLQTLEGEVEADVITSGGTNGRLKVWQVTEPLGTDCQVHFVPGNRCLPESPGLWTGEEKEAPVLWPSMEPVVFPSTITSIKRLNEWSDAGHNDNGKNLQQSVIITTLGKGASGGSLYLLRPTQGYLSNPMHQVVWALPFRMSTNITTNRSVWTCESNPRGRSASLGMTSGAAIVDLEKGELTWLCRGSSDVLSQQFDSSGNIVLCGFRNGVISTIDSRLPRPRSNLLGAISKTDSQRPQPRSNLLSRNTNKSKQIVKRYSSKSQHNLSNIDDLYCSHSTVMRMKSAICSIALLRSSEWYLLASAMNGDIQQWDRRFVGKQPLRSYAGHCNSHSLLQLGVDPTERLLFSGGEDCSVRIWSLASGRLLHVAKGLPSPVTTLSWATSLRKSNSSQWGGFSEEYPFKEDNVWSVWLGSSSSLFHMCGAAR